MKLLTLATPLMFFAGCGTSLDDPADPPLGLTLYITPSTTLPGGFDVQGLPTAGSLPLHGYEQLQVSHNNLQKVMPIDPAPENPFHSASFAFSEIDLSQSFTVTLIDQQAQKASLQSSVVLPQRPVISQPGDFSAFQLSESIALIWSPPVSLDQLKVHGIWNCDGQLQSDAPVINLENDGSQSISVAALAPASLGNSFSSCQMTLYLRASNLGSMSSQLAPQSSFEATNQHSVTLTVTP